MEGRWQLWPRGVQAATVRSVARQNGSVSIPPLFYSVLRSSRASLWLSLTERYMTDPGMQPLGVSSPTPRNPSRKEKGGE